MKRIHVCCLFLIALAPAPVRALPPATLDVGQIPRAGALTPLPDEQGAAMPAMPVAPVAAEQALPPDPVPIRNKNAPVRMTAQESPASTALPFPPSADDW